MSRTLVPAEVARWVLNLNPEQLQERVDNGHLLWVFDVKVSGRRAELRFWERELREAAQVCHLRPDQAVHSILGLETRKRFRGSELCALLDISKQHLQRLHQSRELTGEIISHTRWIQRSSVEAFLHRRLTTATTSHFSAGERER